MDKTKYAMIMYGDEGVYYYIPLLRDGTIEQAIDAALEQINSGVPCYDDGDVEFEIVEVANTTEHNTSDHQAFFNKKAAAARKRQKEQQDRIEKEQFERLKKKFDSE